MRLKTPDYCNIILPKEGGGSSNNEVSLSPEDRTRVGGQVSSHKVTAFPKGKAQEVSPRGMGSYCDFNSTKL